MNTLTANFEAALAAYLASRTAFESEQAAATGRILALSPNEATAFLAALATRSDPYFAAEDAYYAATRALIAARSAVDAAEAALK